MAIAITVYQSEDGQLHRSREDAEFADFAITMREDIGDFLRAQQRQDPDGHTLRLLCDWELWKFGGFAGWLEHRRLEQAGETVVRDLLPPAPPPPLVPPARRPVLVSAIAPHHIKHVGVVGLVPNLHSMIEKEFREAFRLTILDPDESHKIGSLKQCHKVFVMQRTAGKSQIEAVKALGQEPLRITGGVSSLREAMLTLYANS